MILFFLCIYISKQSGYATTVLIKLGLKEPVAQINWCQLGWNNSLEQLNYDSDIIFFGDSITYNGDYQEEFSSYKIVNLGYPGDTLDNMLQRSSVISSLTPEKIFILAGINGLTDNSINDSFVKYDSLISSIAESNPNAEIFIESLLPISTYKESAYCSNNSIIEFNNLLKIYCSKNRYTYVDLYSLYVSDGSMIEEYTKDGIHLKPEYYRFWYDKLSEYIN